MQLASQGAQVIVTARRAERLATLQQESDALPGKLIACPGDITDGQHQANLLAAAHQHWGRLDVLVNNAGVGAFGAFQDSTADTIRRMFEVNLFAAADMMRQALPLLVRGQSPIIVNVGSVLGHFPVPLKAEYCASKSALRALSNAARMELRMHGIDVLLVSPSTTDSEFFDHTLQDSTKLNWKRFGAISPDRVAQRTVLAIQRGKRELFLGKGARTLTLAYRLFPRLTESLLQRDAAHVADLSSHPDR